MKLVDKERLKRMIQIMSPTNWREECISSKESRVLKSDVLEFIDKCALPSEEGTELQMSYINPKFFEHLLNCLANQKYVDNFQDKEKAQEIIDKAWNEGMKILTKHKKEVKEGE